MLKTVKAKIFYLLFIVTSLYLIVTIINRKAESAKIDLFFKEKISMLNRQLEFSLQQISKSTQILSLDYSRWDEMVSFVTTRDSSFAKYNIEPAISTYETDAFIVFDKNYEKIYSRFSPLAKNISELTNLNLQPDKLFAKKNFNHFYFYSDSSLIELFTAPIQPSSDVERTSQPKGYLLTGKIWNKADLFFLSDKLNGKTTLSPVEADSVDRIFIQPSNYSILFNKILPNWKNEPEALLKFYFEVSTVKDLAEMNRKQFISDLIIGLLTFGFLSFFLFYFINKPIDLIFKTLKNEDIKYSTPILEHNTEFSELVKLISSYFNQQKLLKAQIEAKDKVEKTLQFRAEFEDLIASISTTFINLETQEIDKGINHALLIIGNFIKVDRSYVFMYSDNYKIMSNTHEWCADGVSPQIESLQNLSTDIFPWWNSKLMMFENIFIPDISKMPEEATVEKEILEQQNIKSLLVVPMISTNQLIGFIGFDSVKDFCEWDHNVVRLLKLVSDAIANALERKKFENELSLSEKKHRNLVNNLKEVIFETDSEGMWTFLNPAWTEITGFSIEESIGKNFLDFVHPDDRQRNIELFKPLIAREKDFCRHIVRYLTKDGNSKFIEVHARLIVSNSGQILGTAGSLSDVNDRILAEEARKQAETEIRNALEREKELNEMKSRFVSMISHEFRTPLTTIFSSTELIERYHHKWSEEKKGEHLTRIKKSCIELTEMLDLVLTFSKAEAGKLTFNPAPMNLTKFCDEIISEFQLQAIDTHKITYSYNGLSNDLFLDEKLLKHILTNLLSNAIKYSPQGGDIFLNVTQNDNNLIFAIKDQGIGIPAEEQKNLFEMFYRTQNVGNIKGTGLGLAIVKKAIEIQGGFIKFESEINKGTTFIISIPIYRPQEGLNNENHLDN